MNHIKLRSIVVAVSGALLFGTAVPAMADRADDIINAMMAKGVLTEEEGAVLMKGGEIEREVAATKKKSEIKASFKDGIVWQSGDKQHKVSINGRVQADYRSFSDDDANKQADTWDIRRAYIGAKGTFYDTYDFEVTMNSGDLLYAWLNLRYFDQAQLKLGQFKQPFSMEELGSSRFLNFTERSFLTQLVPAVDRGAQLHGNFKGFTYALGMFNGVGVNGGTNVNDDKVEHDGKSYTGRVTANFAELLDNKDAVFHLGAAYSNTTDNGSTKEISLRSEGRGTDILKTNTLNAGYDIKRTGLEGAVAYGPVKLQGEWLKAKFEGDGVANVVSGGTAGDKDIKAWYAAVNWMITGEKYADIYKNGLFSNRLKPKNEFNPKGNNFGWGAWEIGARYSKFDATDFVAADTVDVYDATGQNGEFNEAKSWTLGLKWIPSPNTRFLLNYVKTDMDCVAGFTCTNDEEKAMNLRAQFDF